MPGFLYIVGVISYCLAVLSFAVSVGALQLINFGVFAICGTVAMTGAAILNRLPTNPAAPLK